MTLLIPTYSLWYAVTFAFMCLGIIGFVSLSVAVFVLLRPENARKINHLASHALNALMGLFK